MDYWLSFLMGFFGSMHCIGMCGAIVLAYSTQSPFQTVKPISTLSYHLMYNIGRIFSYTLVGGLLGLIGSEIAYLQVIAHWFTLIGGTILVLLGFYSLKIFQHSSISGKFQFESTKRDFLSILYKNILGKLISSPTVESKFYIGMLTPLLPCGLSYSMFIKAASSMNPIMGASNLLLFGIGIAPALIITGLVSSFFKNRLRRIGDKLAAITIIIMGLMMATKALGIGLPFMGQHHQMH